MKLVLLGFGKDPLRIDVEQLARSYGIKVLESAHLVYENGEEFLASLEEGNDDTEA